MSLKKKWFDMTKAGIKTEDYREINEYWTKRLLMYVQYKQKGSLSDLVEKLNKGINFKDLKTEYYVCFKHFDKNIMTLGYPKSTDKDRILNLEHKGIEIGEGNPEWGAELGKKYFIIKHGKIMNNI